MVTARPRLTTMSIEQPDRRWHAALAYALLGPPVRDLVEVGAPNLPELIAELGPVTTNARPVVTDRALTNDERRLLADRPPHHGG